MTAHNPIMSASPAMRRIARPYPDILLGGAATLVFFVGFVGWSAQAPLDSAAHAAGQVTVAGSRQLVQHLEGGEVSALLVKEGDVVAAGQPLIELNAAEARANERALTAQVVQRQAQLARIRAEMLGQAFVTPANFVALTGEDKTLADEAEAMARRELAARNGAYSTEQAVLSRRVDQLREQITGGRVQAASNERQQGFVGQELDGMRRLAAQGYAPMTRVRSLERSAAELEGANGAQRADIARLNAGVGEIRLQMTQASANRSSILAEEARTTETELASLLPQLEAARQKLDSSRVTAPIAGTVMAMSVHTVGGVTAAGQNLMEIVPLKPSLTMDVRVQTRDVEGLEAGQVVEVKFPGLANRRTPVLHGNLSVLSPDTVVDERTGVAYYMAKVVVSEAELKKIDNVNGQRVALRPGMAVEVLIRKHKRSLLQYLFEPLTSTLWSQGGQAR